MYLCDFAQVIFQMVDFTMNSCSHISAYHKFYWNMIHTRIHICTDTFALALGHINKTLCTLQCSFTCVLLCLLNLLSG